MSPPSQTFPPDPDDPIYPDDPAIYPEDSNEELCAAPAAAEPLVVQVPDGAAIDRADRVLAGLLPDLSRTRLKQLIGEGAVRLDGAALTDPSAKVKPGQIFAIFVPDAQPALPRAQAMDLVVVHEDDDLIVIDKPAGLVVHPAPGNQELTLVNALLHHCGHSLTGIGGVLRPGIVHRIDKDTSGLLVAAKTARAHAGLSAQFAAHSVDRHYRALAWGLPSPPEGEIAGAIGRDPGDRKRMAVVNRGGKDALTRYRITGRYAKGAVSQVECRLATGRTHQIRVHLAHIGHPLVGDRTYGRVTRQRLMMAQQAADFPRQALHAASLGFTHPASGLRLSFSSPLPPDMEALLASLEAL